MPAAPKIAGDFLSFVLTDRADRTRLILALDFVDRGRLLHGGHDRPLYGRNAWRISLDRLGYVAQRRGVRALRTGRVDRNRHLSQAATRPEPIRVVDAPRTHTDHRRADSVRLARTQRGRRGGQPVRPREQRFTIQEGSRRQRHAASKPKTADLTDPIWTRNRLKRSGSSYCPASN